MNIKLDKGEACSIVVPTTGHASSTIRVLDANGHLLCSVTVVSDDVNHPRRHVVTTIDGCSDGRATAAVPGGSSSGIARLKIDYDRMPLRDVGP